MAVDLSDIKLKQNRDFDIDPVPYEQVIQAGDDYYIISAADSTIVKEINDVDNRLHVKYNRQLEFFVLFAREEINGDLIEYLVRTFKKLDPRIVERVKYISDPSYDFVKEGEELEEQAHREKEYAIEQKIGETAEKLAHALRKELGVKGHAYFDDTRVDKTLISNDKEFLGGVRTKDG